MSTFRGLDGAVSLGGVISAGSPLVQGAVAQGASSATFDGSPLRGVILPGDKFTVAGDAQQYTIVTGGAIGAVTPNQIAISFTPNVVPGGGWADNAAVTFVSNSLAEVTEWSLNAERDLLEDTVMGDIAKTFKAGLNMASGVVTCWLDYGDAEQKKLIDDIKASGSAVLGLVLITATSKQFWGMVVATGLQVNVDKQTIVSVSFNYQAATPFAVNWN